MSAYDSAYDTAIKINAHGRRFSVHGIPAHMVRGNNVLLHLGAVLIAMGPPVLHPTVNTVTIRCHVIAEGQAKIPGQIRQGDDIWKVAYITMAPTDTVFRVFENEPGPAPLPS